MNVCKGVGKEEEDYYAGTGRSINRRLVDYLPPKKKKKATRIANKVWAQKYAEEKERNWCSYSCSGRNHAAQNVSCEDCKKQIRAAQRQ